MATGSGLGNLIPLAMTLAGIVTILKARRRRKRGEPDEEKGPDARRDQAREMERRMAQYLAQRDAARHSGGGYAASPEQTGRENGQ